ncbi:M20/M25/M40 family metallo-hydrolase [Lolliginicoccus suaedae]|uniref:M20/M25/M40 family metallo-hydrolase n=1 Tax=Lolliginicoccus suaedae TaxID=2605429 RepID=UPI0011EE886B|nr:M20/M25/M40 family metallo-hydrolase [Lolliginicoccus suaedae]
MGFSRRAGLLGLVILLLVAMFSAAMLRMPDPLPADAESGQFSAGRALEVVGKVAQAPHPAGTAEHARVRDYIVGELEGMGLLASVEEAVGRTPEHLDDPDLVDLARAQNIVARLPGTDPTGSVYLAAHYDSVASGPGANDDGAGVAVVLETVRALVAGDAPLRNDLVVLITDAEELGLIGAEAYARGFSDDDPPRVVINHEARGARGPVLLFRTTSPNDTLIRDVAGAAPHLIADSATSAFAAALPNDTDFSALDVAGFTILDLAYIGGGAYYHNVVDTPAHVDPSTVQQFGDNTLAMARVLGGADLRASEPREDLVYFSVPGGALITYPTWLATVLALVSLAGLGALLFSSRRAVPLRRVVLGGLSTFAAIVAGAGVVLVMWWAVNQVRPGYAALTDAYRPWFYYGAVIAGALAALTGWYHLGRRMGATALAYGGLGVVTIAGAVLSFAVPVAGHFVTLPALGAVAGALVSRVVPGAWRVLATTAGLLPAAFFLSVALWPSLQIGMSQAALLIVGPVVLLAVLLAPLLEAVWPRRRGVLIPVTALAGVVGLAGCGLAVDTFSPETPEPVSLTYAMDVSSGEAMWMSSIPPNRWSADYVDTKRELVAPFTHLSEVPLHTGPAEPSDLPQPELDVIADDVQGNERTLDLRLGSERGAGAVGVFYESADTIRSLTVDGREVLPVPTAGFVFHAPPAEGLEITIVAEPGELTLQAFDYSRVDAGGVRGFRPPPPEMFLHARSNAFVLRTVTL